MSGRIRGGATLVRRSLAHRPLAATATFLAVLLGTALIGSFATLGESAIDAHGDDAGTLVILGAVVGGWGAVIVLFSVASTVGITATQRGSEIALLRTIGATPRQTRRLIVRETGLIALVAALGGATLGGLGGPGLFALIRSGGLVSSRAEYGGTPASLAAAAGLVLAVSWLAAHLAARRATAGPAGALMRESTAERAPMPWWRSLLALLLIGYGLAMAVITVTVTAHDDDPYAAMSTSGSSAILVGVGLAVLAPALLRWCAAPVWRLAGSSGATMHLASSNTARRAHLLAGVLAPVIVLTSAAMGTLMLVNIDGRTLPQGTPDSDTINLLNNVVVGMIALFAAIMVLNAFVAAVAHRRAELERLHRLGATPRQVGGSVVAEAAIVAAIGALLGTIASTATVVPFAIARHEGVVPDGALWLPPAIVAAVVLLTLGSARVAVRPTVSRLTNRMATEGAR